MLDLTLCELANYMFSPLLQFASGRELLPASVRETTMGASAPVVEPPPVSPLSSARELKHT